MEDPNNGKTQAITAVTGLNWGDEGKGKIVDYFATDAEYTIRFQGGANAGHTVVVDGDEIVLHHIPSGIVHDHTICALGNGVVVNPETFMEEVESLNDQNINPEGRLFVSPRCHVVLPYHRILDKELDGLRGDDKIGTTGRGIGPCHADKMSYWGVRLGDVLNPDVLRKKVEGNLKWKAPLIQNLFDREPPAADEIVDRLVGATRNMAEFIHPVDRLLMEATQNNRTMLLEGAQGTLLDVDHGTYPFVTASNTSATGVYSGTGLPFGSVNRIVCVAKAYTTRVGRGPFPTELDGEEGERLREKGNEFGSTTGRPRRCGWFDLVASRYACRVNGADALALTKLDILSGLDTIKICTEYTLDGAKLDDYPTQTDQLQDVQPTYKSFSGWDEDISSCRTFPQLPGDAKRLVSFLEDRLQCPIKWIGVGPGRKELIRRRDSTL